MVNRARWVLSAACLTAFSLTAAKAGSPEDARRAYDAGHFTDAMGLWAKLSAEGNAEAEFGLGLLYDLGNGTPENPANAFAWYKLAAEAGVAEAEFNVGAMYDAGRGVERNLEQAALWYAQAAARGNHRAQFALGLLYEQGEGLPRNPEAASAWFEAALNGGVPAAGARLKALKAEAAHDDHTRPSAAIPISDVTLAWPLVNASLPSAEDQTVTLVWTAPRAPRPVHYEVQVRAMNGPTETTIFQHSASTTAMLVHLPNEAAFYAWKVDTVGQDGSHIIGNWRAFSVGLQPRTKQSMTSAPAPNTDR